MQGRLFAAALAAALGLAPTQAAGYVAHTVEPGETLWSIAAASNFTTRSLAAANGLSENAQVVVGQTIQVPSEAEAAAALAGTGSGTVGTATTQPPPAGAYTVQPGDSLSAIAAHNGLSVDQIAWMNGLDPDGVLISGTALKLPTSAPDAGEAVSPPPVVTEAHPIPTNEFVSPAEVEQVAVDHGVSGSLAAAIAEQESGFNNGLVSSANARGVMQILPGTWEWIEDSIAGRDLDPASAYENVHAGTMYLSQLLQDTGGDESLAAGSYYQGLGSVQENGFFPETQDYVDSVFGLRQKYGGP
jgi:N-acetylmuramoyl-L-alanine amidase